jgi:hypothetical protein
MICIVQRVQRKTIEVKYLNSLVLSHLVILLVVLEPGQSRTSKGLMENMNSVNATLRILGLKGTYEYKAMTVSDERRSSTPSCQQPVGDEHCAHHTEILTQEFHATDLV